MLARGKERPERYDGPANDAAILKQRQGVCSKARKIHLRKQLRYFATPACRSFMKNLIVKLGPSAALILVFGLAAFALAPGVYAKGQSAKKLYKEGEAAEARNDIETAYQDYFQAYQKKPEDLRYKTAYERVRFDAAALHVSRGEKLRSQGDTTGAMTEFLRALQIDPSNDLARQEIRETRQAAMSPSERQQSQTGGLPIPRAEAQELSEIGGPIQLKPISNEPLTLHMVED